MATNRQTDPYGGRFSRDVSQSGVAAGYQQAVSKLDTDLVRRNIKPYAKYGFEQSLRKLAGMNDQQRYDESAAAVVARFRDNRPGKPPAGGGTPKPPSGGGRPPSSGGSKAPPKGSGRPPAKKGGPTPAQRRKARQKAADIARRAAAAAEEVRRKRAALEARRRAGLKPPAQNSPPRQKPPNLPPRQKPKPTPPKPGAGGRARPE